jgi:hypothetical protein
VSWNLAASSGEYSLSYLSQEKSMQPLIRSRFKFLMILASLLAQQLHAQPASTSNDDLNRELVFGIAASVNRFNSSYNVIDSGGPPITIDGESDFGLDETVVSGMLYGSWRINGKHGLGIQLFRIDRQGSTLAFDKNFGNLNVNGEVGLSDQSRFYYANYSYTLKEDDSIWIKGLVGIYTLDLDLALRAEGEVTIGGIPIASGVYEDSINLTIPAPMFGLQFWARASENWRLGSRLSMVVGTHGDYSVQLFQADISARYKFSERFGLVTGVNYFNADVDIRKETETTEIEYGYDGFYLGLDFTF